jgi:hypothetical protein
MARETKLSHTTLLPPEQCPNNILRVDAHPVANSDEELKVFNTLDQDYASVTTYADALKPSQFLLWHKRLHIGDSTLLKTSKIADGIDLGNEKTMPAKCEPCVVANAKRANHPTSNSKETLPGTLLHADHGIYATPTIHGETGYLLIGDDANHYIELICQKQLTAEETLSAYKKVAARIENENSTKTYQTLPD